MTKFQAILGLMCVLLAAFVGADREGETTFTAKEQAALERFKKLVISKIPKSSYIQNYINDDLYFMGWLRAKSLSVGAAEKLFLSHLKWREDEKIDGIVDEDWSDMKREFPVFTDTFDKDGRPTSELWLTDWDSRAGVLAGKLKRIVRWISTHSFEKQTRQVYEARAAGKNVSQANYIVGVEGFNIAKHGCPACLPIYAAFVPIYEHNYPGLYKDGFIVDMPPAFEIIIGVMRPLMSPASRKVMKVFSNRATWMKLFEERFDKDQRSIRFGGMLSRGLE